MATATKPTIVDALSAANDVLNADEKLHDLLRARADALAMGLPDRQVQIEDIDADLVFIRRKLDVVEAYTKRERERNGW